MSLCSWPELDSGVTEGLVSSHTPFHLMRITASLQSRIGLFLISCLWLSGCATAYQHMNDPSRDAWQKPKDVVDVRVAGMGGDS